MSKKKRILVSPLNWGLGHATRSVPVINELLRQNADVIIASDGDALFLLRKEFPDLPFISLPPYGVRYRRKNMFINMLVQTPRIVKAAISEHQMIQEYVKTQQLDCIISDSRFGVRSNAVKSILLTHQLKIQVNSNPRNRILKPVYEVGSILINKINSGIIKKFDECWVPDNKSEVNLSGDLSHSNSDLLENKVSVRFIGLLTRMLQKTVERKYDAVAVLSGPEPQRSILEEIIIRQCKMIPDKNFLLIQGVTTKNQTYKPSDNIEVIPLLSGEQLNHAVLSADVYIGRPGYTTLMDLAVLRKPAILVPTPGQTEQIYLSQRLSEKGIFYFQDQDNLSVSRSLSHISNSQTMPEGLFIPGLLEKTISDLLESL